METYYKTGDSIPYKKEKWIPKKSKRTKSNKKRGKR